MRLILYSLFSVLVSLNFAHSAVMSDDTLQLMVNQSSTKKMVRATKTQTESELQTTTTQMPEKSPAEYSYFKYKKLEGHAKAVVCLVELNDHEIATGSRDHTVKIWNVKTESVQFEMKHYSIRSLLRMDQQLLLIGSENKNIDVWDLAKYNLVKTIRTDSITSLVRLNGTYFLGGYSDGTMRIWSITDWGRKVTSEAKKLITTPQAITTLLLLSSSQIAVANDVDFNIRIYDINTFKLIFTMSGHTDWINTLVQLNSTHIISGSDDRTVKLWDINAGSLQETLLTFGAPVEALLNLNNGLMAAGLGSDSNNLAIINTEEWTVQSHLDGHTGPVYSLILLSNGKIASGSRDATSIIWQQF